MKKLFLVISIITLLVGCSTADTTESPTESPDPSAAVLSPPSGSEEGETSIRTINMESDTFYFRPNKLTLKKGEPVRLKFHNHGLHSFDIAELGVHFVLQGESVTHEFTPDKVGTFEFYCIVEDHDDYHREFGMLGTVTVTE